MAARIVHQVITPLQKWHGRPARVFAFAFIFFPSLLILGCGPSKEDRIIAQAIGDYNVGNFDRAREQFRPFAEKTDENFVLNNVRLGSSSLPDYQLDQAEAAFLRAYEVINSVGVNSGGRSLGAALVDEKIKVWKGEPFERAMVNFYLGMIYYMRHDYGNARGAFENALFKLKVEEESKDDKSKDGEGKYRDQESNFALAYIMLGKSWQRLGREDLARASFQRAVELTSYLAPLADYDRNLKSNVLLVVDYGYGPRKITNPDGDVVGFSPTPLQEGPMPQPLVTIDGRTINTEDVARPPMDLLAMGQDRKWQDIDTIRAIKSGLGTGLQVGGVIAGIHGLGSSGSQQRSSLIAAGALLAAGTLLKASSHADIRQWEMLPRTTYVIPLHLDPGAHDIRIDFDGGISQTWRNIIAPKEGEEEATYYFRMLRYNSGPFDWPPGAPVSTAPVAQTP